MSKHLRASSVLVLVSLFCVAMGAVAQTNVLVVREGKVGINTDDPKASQLHIFGSEDADVYVGMGNDPTWGGAGGAFNMGYGGRSWGPGAGFFNVRPTPSAVPPNPSLRFWTNDTGRIIITNTGNVGIGTNFTSPLSLLHVNNGDIRVSNGSFIADSTTLNVPDYVFERDYELMPLDALASFIEREKHLPEVASAKEINKNGLNVSEFQMQLLKKIEELTLYTLAQEKQLQEQSALLEQLLP